MTAREQCRRHLGIYYARPVLNPAIFMACFLAWMIIACLTIL